MNIGEKFRSVLTALSLVFLTAGQAVSAVYPVAIEYKETMVKVLQESDLQGWPTGHETDGRYPYIVVVSANGAKVGLIVKMNSYADWRTYVMNGDGSGLVNITGNLPSGVNMSNLQFNDDGSRLFFLDSGTGNIYYFDTSPPYACHSAYQPNNSWPLTWRTYSLSGDGTLIYLMHLWSVNLVNHYGLCSTVVESNVLTPLVDVQTLTPAPAPGAYALNLLDAARTGGRVLLNYYPDYFHDTNVAMWESTPLQPIPNERHQYVWNNVTPRNLHIMSADGSLALYEYADSSPAQLQLQLINLNTGQRTTLMQSLNNNAVIFPALSPDGSVAVFGTNNGYYASRWLMATGDIRDTFSNLIPESGASGYASGYQNITDITSNSRNYYVGSRVPGDKSYVHLIDMVPSGGSPAPGIVSISFAEPQLVLGDSTPIQITVQVSDPKGVDNIQWVQIHTLVDGHENPSGISPPLSYTAVLTSSGGGVYTGTVYAYIYSNFYTLYQLPKPVGVRVVVKDKDEHYAVADTSITVQPASTVKPLRVSETSLDYSSLHDAYAALMQRGGGTILARVYEFVEDLILDTDIPVIFEGGYDTGYSVNSGSSSLWGTVTIGHGSLVVENLIIK